MSWVDEADIQAAYKDEYEITVAWKPGKIVLGETLRFSAGLVPV